MDYSRTFEISAAGMAVERMRVDVATLNLANASTIASPDGVSYQPLHVVARSGTAVPGAFAAQVEGGLEPAGVSMPLPEAVVVPSAVSPRSVYEPGHPFANEKGFVTYPGVDTATEMVTLMRAVRAYEANVAAMNTARALALKTLDIGSGS